MEKKNKNRRITTKLEEAAEKMTKMQREW